MRTVKIRDRKYYRNIYLICGFTEDKINSLFKRKYPKAEVYSPGKKDAHFFAVINDESGIEDFYVCIRKFDWTIPDLGLLAHETFHLVFEALDRVGLKFSNDSEEAYAYYFDSILQGLMWELRPKKHPIPKEGR